FPTRRSSDLARREARTSPPRSATRAEARRGARRRGGGGSARSSSDRDEDDDEDGEPARDGERIGAEEAGLRLGDAARDVPHTAAESRDRPPDDERLHDPPEEAGQPHRGPVEGQVVRLVEVELP